MMSAYGSALNETPSGSEELTLTDYNVVEIPTFSRSRMLMVLSVVQLILLSYRGVGDNDKAWAWSSSIIMAVVLVIAFLMVGFHPSL